MKVKVLLFGSLGEICNAKELTIENIDNLLSLVQYLKMSFPRIGNIKFRVAVNREMAQVDRKLYENDEVALLPPSSGG